MRKCQTESSTKRKITIVLCLFTALQLKHLFENHVSDLTSNSSGTSQGSFLGKFVSFCILPILIKTSPTQISTFKLTVDLFVEATSPVRRCRSELKYWLQSITEAQSKPQHCTLNQFKVNLNHLKAAHLGVNVRTDSTARVFTLHDSIEKIILMFSIFVVLLSLYSFLFYVYYLSIFTCDPCCLYKNTGVLLSSLNT